MSFTQPRKFIGHAILLGAWQLKERRFSMRNCLGAQLRRLRIKKGLSQEQLADALGLSQSTVARIEAGKSKLGAHHLLLVCEALEMSLEQFLNA